MLDVTTPNDIVPWNDAYFCRDRERAQPLQVCSVYFESPGVSCPYSSTS
jgi:hypothetical protein